jgi:hypothetical protein
MNNARVEHVSASFPHPILATVQGELYYHIIHSIIKLLRANARSIETHLGGGPLGHLGIIVSITGYVIVTPEDPRENPEAPGRGPEEIGGGTAAQLAVELHHWE